MKKIIPTMTIVPIIINTHHIIIVLSIGWGFIGRILISFGIHFSIMATMTFTMDIIRVIIMEDITLIIGARGTVGL